MMNVVRKVVSALGGIFLAALLIAALAPKATRGIAAALVQVTNTFANPVPNQEVTKSASRLVTLACNLPPASCLSVGAGGSVDLTSYTVPAGEQLVITDIEINTAGGGGVTLFALLPAASCTAACLPPTWFVANDGTTQVVHPSGLAWPAGGSFILTGTNINASIVPAVTMRGYLTPD